MQAAGSRSARKSPVISRRGSSHAANAFVDQVIQLVVHLPERLANEIGHDEYRRRNPFSLQHRERLLVDVPVAVVERHGGDRLVEAPAAGDVLADLIQVTNVKWRPMQSRWRSNILRADQHARHLGARSRRRSLRPRGGSRERAAASRPRASAAAKPWSATCEIVEARARFECQRQWTR